jgi:putative glutamine amidotransferase
MTPIVGLVCNRLETAAGGEQRLWDTYIRAARDGAGALPLIVAAAAAGKPIFCICRGFQELNVALGGTLYQAVHEVPGRFDHREKPDAPPQVQFAPAHDVTVREGGLLARLLPERRFRVNSLHGQGIDRLAAPLAIEAVAPDGQIEAVSMPASSAPVFGVQWHPEWNFRENLVSARLFSAFGEALTAARR